MKLPGRNRLPDDAAHAVFADSPLLPGERVLDWAQSGEAWVVATTLGLRWAPAYPLVRWDEIDHVSYAVGSMTIQPHNDTLHLDDVRRLPEVVRERVNASIAVDRHLRLTPDGAGVRVIARRRSDTGELRWETSYDAAIDPADPAIQRRAALALDDVRSLFA